jgi:hypothetical protein
MPCCLLTLTALFPRVALILMWLAGYGGRAFETVVWPVLGFVLMPYTTCAYAIGMNEAGGFRGWTLVVLIVAVILDIGNHSGGGAYSTRYRRVRLVD